mgnify:FL=1|tara:strand:- start:435 stop:1061 length:627 start_codon:yes stop_codon:yes gene_type:complete
MAFPTTNAAQELPAVNEILASVGQAPVTTLDQTNPDVAIAYDTLLNVSREVQAEGWTFNTEEYYPMTPDANGEIVIANNILQIDLHDEKDNQYESVRRSGKLYEKINHTYDWTTLTGWDTVRCDIVWFFDWVDLPRPIQDYIVAKAATVVSSRLIGDPQQFRMLQAKEMDNRSKALEYECNQGDYTFFGHKRGEKVYDSYKPYQALYR